jgi:hypothetical protein
MEGKSHEEVIAEMEKRDGESNGNPFKSFE